MAETILQQDFLARSSQGPVARRDREHLGQSDIGVIMFRELLAEQISQVALGHDPMAVLRTAAEAAYVDLPHEEHFYVGAALQRMSTEFSWPRLQQKEERYTPEAETIRALFARADAHASSGGELLRPPAATTIPPGGQHHRAVSLRP